MLPELQALQNTVAPHALRRSALQQQQHMHVTDTALPARL